MTSVASWTDSNIETGQIMHLIVVLDLVKACSPVCCELTYVISITTLGRMAILPRAVLVWYTHGYLGEVTTKVLVSYCDGFDSALDKKGSKDMHSGVWEYFLYAGSSSALANAPTLG